MHGTGKITLGNGQFAGLDPRAFDVVSRAVDDGMSIDASAIVQYGRAGRSTADTFRSSTRKATSAVSAGQVRLSELKVHDDKVDLSIAGNVDLTDGALDARLVLSGQADAGGPRPDIYIALNGPLAAPARAVDVSALTGWLTLRAIESQAKKLKAIEGAVPPAPPAGQIQMPKPKTQQAPALPAPVNIGPLRAPPPATRPEASVDPHH